MSAGGVFKLIANDGKPDKLLLATALLNQRISDVVCARRAQGKDATPTLLDIERTHILFLNAHFKPFAAVGYEYNKVRANSGTPTFGGSVQFSIPQFGDFFHDMVLHTVINEVFTGTLTLPTQGVTGTVATDTGPYSITSLFPANGDDWDGTTDALGITMTYAPVDAFGTTAVTNYRNMVRYVEFPAERLCAKVKFDVNGNPLDEYTYRVANMLRKFTITDEKLVGYKRLVGQEVPMEGFSGPRVCSVHSTDYDAAGSAVTTGSQHGPSATAIYAGSIQNNTTTDTSGLDGYMRAPRHYGAEVAPASWQQAHTAQPGTQTDVSVGARTLATATTHGLAGPSGAQWGQVQREVKAAVDGPQTPKYYQPQLETWNKLLFWFNNDARLSIPSVAIPYGQRFITIDLASRDEVIVDFPGIFIRQQSSTPALITLSDDGNNNLVVGNDTVQAGAVYRNYRPYWKTSTISDPTISTLELYINNIFVNPEVHDIFIRRVGFSLIRVYRYHVTSVTGAGSELLSQLKWPIECLFVGFQPTHNADKTTNEAYHRDWHRMGKTFDARCEGRQEALTALTINATALTMTSDLGQIVPDTYVVERPTVTNISLTAHGIKLYDNFPQAFFSSYEPFHFGGAAVRPSTDPGAMMINFALFPGCYQPSGYLNTSRARELYLEFTSSYITTTTPVTLIAVAIAINFLLITDGSAVLRYST